MALGTVKKTFFILIRFSRTHMHIDGLTALFECIKRSGRTFKADFTFPIQIRQCFYHCACFPTWQIPEKAYNLLMSFHQCRLPDAASFLSVGNALKNLKSVAQFVRALYIGVEVPQVRILGQGL